jgi:hypothetical protein
MVAQPRGALVMKEISDEQVRAMQEATRARLHRKLGASKQPADARGAGTRGMLGGVTDSMCTGNLSLSAVVAFTGIKINGIEFNSHDKVIRFKGSALGLGAGYTASFGTGAFTYSPNRLIGLGKVKVQIAFAVAGGGVIQTSFWKDKTLFGAMDFIGAGGGGGVFWGDGVFKSA